MPTIRTDIVDLYLFRREEVLGKTRLLQARRARAPLIGTWQPVMGHIEPGETATACMWREAKEETGLTPETVLGVWALEQVHPFYIAQTDEIVMPPRFAAEVPADWEPTLNDEHDVARWAPIDDARERFLWPGQHAAIEELSSMLKSPERLAALRLPTMQ